MTSKIKVDNINKVSDDSNIIKKCGTTTTIGSGASNPIVVDGSAVTIGRCGGTVALASGASQTGFGREGSVNWQTGSIKTATFTATSGEGYFCNTSGGAFTVNLPAGSAGAIVAVADYTRTFVNNFLTISANGSEKIGGVAQDAKLTVNGQSATFVYVDATEGWINVQETQTSVTGVEPFLGATGGTITTCGNCTVHTFTGPGTFQVTRLATSTPAPANNQLSYMVVAGGGGAGGGDNGGGGGAGGFREDKAPVTPYTASPLEGAGTISATVTSFPITVGAGGTGAVISSPCAQGRKGSNGANSVFSTITSAGGGGGAAAYSSSPDGNAGAAGGSGGGGGMCGSPAGGGSGNSPSTTPAQGKNGGSSGPGGGGTTGPKFGASGGGGATAVGQDGTPAKGGDGGAGATTGINFSNTAFAGGGGGGAESGGCSTGGTGGGGPGVGGPSPTSGTPGTANTGGGGGGAGSRNPSITVGNGGSGIVIIRYKSSS